MDPACLSLSPFASTWAQFALVTVCVGLVVVNAVASSFASVCGALTDSSAATAPAEVPGNSKPPNLAPVSGNSPLGCIARSRSVLALLAAFSIKLLVVLYAFITNTTLAALTCTVTPLTVRGYLVLLQDGATLRAAADVGAYGAPADAAILAPNGYEALLAYTSGTASFASLPPALAASAPSLLSSPLSVSVLASNPFIVCHERDHMRVVACAWAVFVLFCLAFPLVCAAWTAVSIDARMSNASVVGEATAARWSKLRRAWLARLRLFSQVLACGGYRALRHPQQHTQPHTTWLSDLHASTAITVNPLLQDAASNCPPSTELSAVSGVLESASPSSAAHAAIDATPAATATSILRALTDGDTRPSFFYFSMLDQAVLLILAVPVAYNTQASGLSGRPLSLLLVAQSGALAASLAATLLAAYAIVHTAPYPSNFAWKARGKVYIYAIAAGSSVVNFLTWWEGVVAEGRASSFSALPELVRVLSLALLAAAALLLLFLAVSFVTSLLAEGRGEGVKELVQGEKSTCNAGSTVVVKDTGAVGKLVAPTPSYAVTTPPSEGGRLWRRVVEEDGDVWWACDATGDSSWDAPAGTAIADGWVRAPWDELAASTARLEDTDASLVEPASNISSDSNLRCTARQQVCASKKDQREHGIIRDSVRELVASLQASSGALKARRRGKKGKAPPA